MPWLAFLGGMPGKCKQSWAVLGTATCLVKGGDHNSGRQVVGVCFNAMHLPTLTHVNL